MKQTEKKNFVDDVDAQITKFMPNAMKTKLIDIIRMNGKIIEIK